jgi:hypothetical protein
VIKREELLNLVGCLRPEGTPHAVLPDIGPGKHWHNEPLVASGAMARNPQVIIARNALIDGHAHAVIVVGISVD